MSSDNSQERPCVVWPLMYFEAQWQDEAYDMSPCLLLVRAQPSELTLMAESLESSAWSDARYTFDGAYALRDDVEWLLVNTFLVEHPQPVENLNEGHEGQVDYLPFLHPVHGLLTKSFLTALCIVKPNQAIAPVAFRAEAASNGRIVRIGEAQERHDLGGDRYETPGCHEETTPFDDEDLERLGQVWPAMAKLRNLQGWAEEMVPERFSSFVELQQEEARGGTRLGRALLLFEDGLRLPLLHAFLSMWLVLETLYTDGHGEVIHKLATRLAWVVAGDSLEARERCFKAAKAAYEARSDIVHGKNRKSQNENTDGFKVAFQFAMRSLERILCDKELFDVFTHPDDSIRGFFRRLDLGVWQPNPEP